MPHHLARGIICARAVARARAGTGRARRHALVGAELPRRRPATGGAAGRRADPHGRTIQRLLLAVTPSWPRCSPNPKRPWLPRDGREQRPCKACYFTVEEQRELGPRFTRCGAGTQLGIKTGSVANCCECRHLLA